MWAKILGGVAVVLVAVFAVILVGGDDDEAAATETDGAFVAEMVPHHESAIEMAEIAIDRAQHPETEALARSIVASQGDEIALMESIHQRLFDEPLSAADHGTLGLAEHEMGMMSDVGTLQTAKPFDRAFIDMMIPHHQGAILMARVELEQGSDAETMELAQAIIDAQASEIEEMNEWRTDWYGEPSPAGGVPSEE